MSRTLLGLLVLAGCGPRVSKLESSHDSVDATVTGRGTYTLKTAWGRPVERQKARGGRLHFDLQGKAAVDQCLQIEDRYGIPVPYRGERLFDPVLWADGAAAVRAEEEAHTRWKTHERLTEVLTVMRDHGEALRDESGHFQSGECVGTEPPRPPTACRRGQIRATAMAYCYATTGIDDPCGELGSAYIDDTGLPPLRRSERTEAPFGRSESCQGVASEVRGGFRYYDEAGEVTAGLSIDAIRASRARIGEAAGNAIGSIASPAPQQRDGPINVTDFGGGLDSLLEIGGALLTGMVEGQRMAPLKQCVQRSFASCQTAYHAWWEEWAPLRQCRQGVALLEQADRLARGLATPSVELARAAHDATAERERVEAASLKPLPTCDRSEPGTAGVPGTPCPAGILLEASSVGVRVANPGQRASEFDVGDVILAVGGQPVWSPAEAARVLASQHGTELLVQTAQGEVVQREITPVSPAAAALTCGGVNESSRPPSRKVDWKARSWVVARGGVLVGERGFGVEMGFQYAKWPNDRAVVPVVEVAPNAQLLQTYGVQVGVRAAAGARLIRHKGLGVSPRAWVNVGFVPPLQGEPYRPLYSVGLDGSIDALGSKRNGVSALVRGGFTRVNPAEAWNPVADGAASSLWGMLMLEYRQFRK